MRSDRPAVEHILRRALHITARAVPEVRLVHAVDDPAASNDDEKNGSNVVAKFSWGVVIGVGIWDWHRAGVWD